MSESVASNSRRAFARFNVHHTRRSDTTCKQGLSLSNIYQNLVGPKPYTFGVSNLYPLYPVIQKRFIYARQYQGWDGDSGKRPSKFALLFRPVVFAGIFLVGSVSAAAVIKEERLKRTKWTLFPKSYHDFWGWRVSTGQVIAGGIVAVNGLVFACWQWSLRGSEMLEHAAPWLRRHFLHYAFSGRAFPLLGSVFSHATFLHFMFNMIALW
jgi:membrane associated rhomboid family serine protease